MSDLRAAFQDSMPVIERGEPRALWCGCESLVGRGRNVSAPRLRCSRRRRGGLGPLESRGRANDRPWTLLHVTLLTSSTLRNPLRRLRGSGMGVMQLKDGSATCQDRSARSLFWVGVPGRWVDRRRYVQVKVVTGRKRVYRD